MGIKVGSTYSPKKPRDLTVKEVTDSGCVVAVDEIGVETIMLISQFEKMYFEKEENDG